MGIKTIWITGSSSGIGRALASEYNRRGYHVVLSARRTELLKEVCLELPHPENASVVGIDLSTPEHAQHWFEEAKKATGKIDVLINNGGMGHLGTVLNMSDEVERRVMETNFWGAVALTKAVLPEMIARGSGQIWTVASILGFFGSPKLAAYAASKFAVVGYFESLQYELRNTGVHVGLVSPGFINTNVTLSSLDSEGKPLGKNSIAQEKGMNPEVFAGKFAAKACRKNPRKHLLIGRAEILSVPFKRLFPKLFFMIYGKLTDITRKK